MSSVFYQKISDKNGFIDLFHLQKM